jgi:hypothetical protein
MLNASRLGRPAASRAASIRDRALSSNVRGLIPIVVVAALIAAAVAVYYHLLFLRSWYVGGPYLYDTELFNYIVGPKGQGLRMPPVINMPTFFNVHVAPILLPFSFISSILNLKDMWPLEMVLLLGFSGAAVAAFVAVRHFLRPLGGFLSIVLAALFALAFALCGVMRQTADYPHIEVLYVAPAIVTLMLIFHRNFHWAWLSFFVTLFCREDSGLHLACILGAYLVLAAIGERKLIPSRTRDVAPFLVLAIVYPAVVLTAQKWLLPIDSNFARIYSGTPPYAHLNVDLLIERFQVLAAHPAAPLLLVAALVPALIRPRWVALTGLLAAAPWFLVSVTAFSDSPGTFALYYAFPFLVLTIVPFVVAAELPSAEIVYVDHL